VNHGWKSESTDGPTGGWSRVCWSGCNGCKGHLTTWRSAVVVVVVAVVVVVVVAVVVV